MNDDEELKEGLKKSMSEPAKRKERRDATPEEMARYKKSGALRGDLNFVGVPEGDKEAEDRRRRALDAQQEWEMKFNRNRG